MDDFFPTLFSKTFFVLSSQLFITWATTQILFSFLKRKDPQLEGQPISALEELKQSNPDLFATLGRLFMADLIGSIIVFLVLLFWGVNQSLAVSLSLFSVWSIMTGFQLEYVLLSVDHGVGRKVLALTTSIVLGAALIGIYSHIDFNYLQIPLFIGLIGLLIFNTVGLFKSLTSTSQRLAAIFGVALFTLYLVFDFDRLAQKNAAGANTWSAAMRLAIDIYLDIINLILQLIKLLGHSHH